MSLPSSMPKACISRRIVKISDTVEKVVFAGVH